MHSQLINPYQHRRSWIHQRPASLKLIATVALVFICVLLPRNAWAAYATVGGLLLIVAALSRLSVKHLARKFLWLEPFAVGVAVLSLWQRNGVHVFAAMLVKSSLCLLAMVLLSSTTRFSDMVRVLWRARVPSLLVTTLALMQRYLFLLADESSRMLRARSSRTFTARRLAVWRAAATVVAHLFVRASERAERIYAAMCARGWKT